MIIGGVWLALLQRGGGIRLAGPQAAVAPA
jgi:hypothetical protein